MGKIIQGVVLVLNFAFTIVLCYLYDMNKWISQEQTSTIKSIDQYEGFFRQCKVVNGDETACENYNEWIFSPNFPSWILAGRILLFLAIAGGYLSCLMFLIGSRMSNMFANDESKKLNLRRVASVWFIINGAMVVSTALWIFIMVARTYNRQTASNIWFGGQSSGGQVQKFIPSTACYTAMVLGVAWLANGLAAMFCTGGAFGKGDGYEAGSYR